MLIVQVSFGVFETEEEAAQQYDRALVIEKGRSGSLVDRIDAHWSPVRFLYLCDLCGPLFLQLKQIFLYNYMKARHSSMINLNLYVGQRKKRSV